MQRAAAMLVCLMLAPILAAAPLVRYPVAVADDPGVHYAIALLEMSLSYSGKQYQLQQSPRRMQQARAIEELRSASGSVDLFWSMTSAEREASMIAVKFPLDKGLIGWRIALVKSGQAELFRTVGGLDMLRRYAAGLGQDWPDAAIMRNNGLRVVAGGTYASLFNMLDNGRFDYFPRSVLEIGHEVRSQRGRQFDIEKTLVLHYPAAMYFFVSPRRPELAEDVRLGLEKMLADGSFERVFQQFHRPAIEQANLARRRIIELNNPLLAADSLPLQRQELWFKP